MKTRFTTKSLMAAVMLYSFTCLADSSPNKAPELAAFDVNNLSYSFEKALPSLDKAYIDSSPTNRKDGIAVGDLAVNGDSQKAIIALSHGIADQKYGHYDSLLISHKNTLVFESYYKKGRINLPHFQASVTKSYLSLAIGRAIQLGHLTMADLHRPIVHFVKDLSLKKLADGTENITLHQLMSMRSGVRVNADRLKRIIDNSAKTKGSHITQAFLQHSEAISPESQTFKYQDSDARITMQVLDSVVPGSAKNFINNEVLKKVGITIYGWKNDINGLPIPEVGSSITSRDMLKLGSLVINKGKWNGEQLISAKFLAHATSKITKATEQWMPDAFFYGYFWYQTDMTVEDINYVVKLAWGGGGQYIITVEELDLIVVITGHDFEDKILAQISKTILPAFIK